MMISTCPETVKLELLVSDQSDKEAVEHLLGHIEHCSTCQAEMERRNRLYAAAPFESKRPGVAASGEPQADEAPMERFKRSPAVGRDNRIGHFRIIRKLGEGGMGQVYECLDEKLSRRVAVKWIKTAHLSPEFLQRLEREARIHARLNHPNIVSLLEYGIAEGMPYLVMELVAGCTLRQLIHDQKLGPVESAAIMAEVARGVQAAHDQGVLHRDLKPANILLKPVSAEAVGTGALASGYVPKVTDFGLAKALDIVSEDSDSIHIKGTPFYMAPEHFMGASWIIGPAADVYSLGVILYELLTGRVPLAGRNLGEVTELILNQNPIDPRSIQAGVPLDLQTICMKCLEKLPRLRYGSAGELADDLDRFIQKRPISARPVGTLGKLWRWGRRNPLVALMTGVSLTSVSLLVLSIVMFAYRQAHLRRTADGLRLHAQASENVVRQNYQLIRDKYFRELGLSSENYNRMRRIVDQGTQPAPDPVREFYAKITQQRFDRALEMIRRPELLEEESEYMVEAFYLAALRTQERDQEEAIALFQTAVDRAKAIAAKRLLNPLGRFCAMNSDNFLGVIQHQRNHLAESAAYYRDAWDHFRLVPTEAHKDARLKRFSIVVGNNLVNLLNQLGQKAESDKIRAACAEIDKLKADNEW